MFRNRFQLPFGILSLLSITLLLLTGCNSSNKDKNFEIEKEIYLNCINRIVDNYTQARSEIELKEKFNKARIYCVDLYPNAIR